MSGDYRLVFDMADHPLPLGPGLFIPLVFVAIGALMVFRPVLMQRLLPGGLQGRARRLFSWIYLVFAIAVTGAFLASNLGRSHDLKLARERGDVEVTEGCLEAFHPMAASGHEKESFRLKGRCLAYSDYVITPGFHHTEARGGPVHADSRVRVTHTAGTILRLEVQDHACPAAPEPGVGQGC